LDIVSLQKNRLGGEMLEHLIGHVRRWQIGSTHFKERIIRIEKDGAVAELQAVDRSKNRSSITMIKLDYRELISRGLITTEGDWL
jgi:hypothetical protein